jgi:uncharacterized protein YukE
MSEFSDYVDRATSYENEMFLGRLTYYAITEASHVDHGEFCRALINNGLDRNLPPVPRAVDVFKRSCTAAQRRRVPTDDPNIFVNYNIREVGKDSMNVWRTLVAETVDTAGHTLGYEELFELHFSRDPNGAAARVNGTIAVKPLIEDHEVRYPDAQIIVQTVVDSYQNQNNMLTPYAIREFVRKSLRSLHSTAIRDGMYFVKEAHAAEIAAFETIINDLPGGSMMHSLPLIDDRKQRAMLRKAFEDESVGEIDRMLGEIRDIMSKGSQKITSDRFADFKVQYDSLKEKAAEYADLLETSLDETGSRLEVMNQALFSLMGRIKA